MTSFSSIDYSIRPNKCVERKLLLHLCRLLINANDIKYYRYIGLGCVWFADFILFHKLLGMDDMITIENDYGGFMRAKFNRPYKTIDIKYGNSTEILPSLEIENRKSIIWLDYDKTYYNSSIINDLTIIFERAASGTIVFATVNASPPKPNEEELEQGHDCITILRTHFKDLVSPELKISDIGEGKFPATLTNLLYSLIRYTIKNAGRTEQFVPIATYFYKDGAPMLTIGGILLDADENIESRLAILNDYEFASGSNIYKINVPPLTIREKNYFDKFLPNNEAISAEELESLLGSFSQEQINNYCRFYKYYPVFGEFNY